MCYVSFTHIDAQAFEDFVSISLLLNTICL